MVIGLQAKPPLLASRYTYLRGEPADAGLTDGQIQVLIDRRVAARKGKDWAAADRIRDQLQAAGILLEDGAARTIWYMCSSI